MALAVVAMCPVEASADGRISIYLDAANRFQRLADDARARGEDLPGKSRSDVAAILTTFAAMQTTPDANAYGNDLQAILNTCGAASRISTAYTFAGVEKLKGSETNMDVLQKKLTALASANTYKYQDEIAALVAFGFPCMARATSVMTVFVESLPPEEMTDVRKQGLNQMRNGIVSMITGALTAVPDTQLSYRNKELMLSSAARNMETLVGALTITQRQKVLNVSLGVRISSPPTFNSSLDSIISLLKDEQCIGLCQG